MAITIKTIDQLLSGTIQDTSPVMFGLGTDIFKTTWGTLKAEVVGNYVNDLSYRLIDTGALADSNTVNTLLNNQNVTIAKGEIVFIKFKYIQDNGSIGDNTYLIPLGEGVYNPLGASVAFNSLFLIDRVETTPEPGDANTTTYSVPDLNTINISDPSYDFSNTNFVYFVNLDGVLYEFIGVNGLYGLNNLQINMNDLRLVTGAETITTDNVLNFSSLNPVTNKGIIEGIGDYAGYNPIKFIESSVFPTYTMTDEFELVRENLNQVYFLVRNDVNIDLADCRVKLLENNRTTNLTAPDITQSNYKAYLVNTELYSSILVDGDTYNFTFWRKSLQAIIEQTRSQSTTAVPSSKLLDDELNLKADIAVEQATITNITFAKQQTYGTPAAPLTGAFTVDNIGAKYGMIQKIYHNAASEPTILGGSTFFKAGTGEYVPSVLNVIFIEWITTTRYEYWIVQFS